MTPSRTRHPRGRRRITRTALTTAVAGALLLGTAACTPRQNAASFAAVTSDTITDQLPAATKSVDKVTWAVVEGEPQTLDPTNTANVITPNICTSLLTVNADYSISPGLATKADWVNPVTFRITLRHGLKFSDGSALTADDVVWSLKRNMNEASQWYAAFVLVKSMKAVDSDTVDISFKAPDASFRNSLTGGAGQVLSKAAGTKAGKALGTSAGGLVCDGPYKLAKWVPGTSIDVAANPYYWAGEPRTKTISFRFISDSSTLTNALTAGEIDGATTSPPVPGPRWRRHRPGSCTSATRPPPTASAPWRRRGRPPTRGSARRCPWPSGHRPRQVRGHRAAGARIQAAHHRRTLHLQPEPPPRTSSRRATTGSTTSTSTWPGRAPS